MKKTILLFATINFLSILSYAQAPAWLWAKSAGGANPDWADFVAIDAFGNTYLTGSFESPTLVFGSTTLTNVSGSGDIFLVKYDAAGNVVWAKRAGGTASDEALSVTVDASGNIYITGVFSSPSLIFGSTTLTNISGSVDLFLAKYDAAGNVVWAKSAGGTGDDQAISVAADASGNTYVAGLFASPSLVFGTTTLTNAGSGDLFLVKYDATGNAVWAKSAGNIDVDEANAVAVDASGNVYLTGFFSSNTLSFGSTTLTNVGSEDLFLAKYDASGNVVWAKSAGGLSYDRAISLALDAFGNTYITGWFYSSTLSFGSTTLTNAGGSDLFLAKYDAAGNVVWAKSAGNTDVDEANAVALDANGNVYVAGDFSSASISFASNTLTNSAPGSGDTFIAKYDATGNVFWAKSTGGSGFDVANSMAVDASGNAYLAGVYLSSSLIFGSTTLTNAGSSDIFLAKLNSIVGVSEIHNPLSILVYPNPFIDYLIIEAEQKAKIEILNPLGQTVYTSTLNKKTTLNTSAFPSGVYILKLYTENEIVERRFIKQ
jgi:hypothetical protein